MVTGLGSLTASLFLPGLDGAEHLSDEFDGDLFPDAVAAHGELPYDQSFIFAPLLSLGGTAPEARRALSGPGGGCIVGAL
ncbi:T6SS immunity protein Tdi1 domain-containing protein [Microbacterium sp.]|uniref:T6SS immunity protein Tdi1 domain-containing protein n=1 Tax=Microbacterium sp. TaxID=51671 RepID=UPI0039E651F5